MKFEYPLRTALSFLGLLFSTMTLMLVAITALFIDPTLSPIKGIAWAVDTPDHRLWLVLVLCTVIPVLGVVTGMGLQQRTNPAD